MADDVVSSRTWPIAASTGKPKSMAGKEKSRTGDTRDITYDPAKYCSPPSTHITSLDQRANKTDPTNTTGIPTISNFFTNPKSLLLTIWG